MIDRSQAGVCPVCDAVHHVCSFTRPLLYTQEVTTDMGHIVSDKDLYADANDKIVSADSPDAAFLVARAGTPIPQSTAERYGIKGSEFDQGKALEEQEEARRQTLSEPSHGPAPKNASKQAKAKPTALDPDANPPATR